MTKEPEEPMSTKRKQAALEAVSGLGPPVKKARTYAPATVVSLVTLEEV